MLLRGDIYFEEVNMCSKRHGEKVHFNFFRRGPVHVALYPNDELKYYATFKVRKVESLLYRINKCLQKLTVALDCRQSKYSQ